MVLGIGEAIETPLNAGDSDAGFPFDISEVTRR
jgi:hypothetical protein